MGPLCKCLNVQMVGQLGGDTRWTPEFASMGAQNVHGVSGGN